MYDNQSIFFNFKLIKEIHKFQGISQQNIFIETNTKLCSNKEIVIIIIIIYKIIIKMNLNSCFYFKKKIYLFVWQCSCLFAISSSSSQYF